MKITANPVAAVAMVACLFSAPVFGWGDEGHEIVGLIAKHYLDPAVLRKVSSLLKSDTTHLTASTEVDQEATWADKFRDSDRDTTQAHYRGTGKWHFVDLELAGPDLRTACFGEPPLEGALASNGPSADCIVDKITEFTSELRSSSVDEHERLLALQFLLHFVGDLHQPLHASDDHDKGGNAKRVRAPGIRAGNLHHYWDTEFVNLLGADASAIAQRLIAAITDRQRANWSRGNAADWAMESFHVAKIQVYGQLPPPRHYSDYVLPSSYVTDAQRVVGQQLSKAGVRLAVILNESVR